MGGIIILDSSYSMVGYFTDVVLCKGVVHKYFSVSFTAVQF